MASKRKVVEPQPEVAEAPAPPDASASADHVEVDPLVEALQKRIAALEARLDEAAAAAVESARALAKVTRSAAPVPVGIVTSQTGALVLADPRAIERAAAAAFQGTKASYVVDVLGPAEAVQRACTASRLPFQPIAGGQRILSQGKPQAEMILTGIVRWCAVNKQPLEATIWCTGSVEFRARAASPAVIDVAGQPALALTGRSFAVTVTQEGGQPVYHIRPQ